MDRDTELALVTSLRAGAPAAFDAVYQEFNDRLLTFGPRFNGLFDEGRRSVTVEPEAPSSDVRSGATSAPLSAPEPRAVEPPGPAVGGSVASPMPDDIPADLPPPSLGAERKPACTEPWKCLYILRRGVFPRCYGASQTGGPTAGPIALTQAEALVTSTHVVERNGEPRGKGVAGCP